MKLIRAFEVLGLVIAWIVLAILSVIILFVQPWHNSSFIPIAWLVVCALIVLIVRFRRRRATRQNQGLSPERKRGNA